MYEEKDKKHQIHALLNLVKPDMDISAKFQNILKSGEKNRMMNGSNILDSYKGLSANTPINNTNSKTNLYSYGLKPKVEDGYRKVY